MKVLSLKIEGFRNLGTFSMQPCSGSNIIGGDNAQGKTNLLESIWLFTGSKSFRGSRERDFIPKEKTIAGIELEFLAANRKQTILIRWQKNQRNILLNGIKKESFSELAGIFCGVVFSPDHMQLIKSGPDFRRQMIDSSLSQAYPKYSSALNMYNKALKQRNTLLKDILYHSSLIDMLDLWDQHIIDYGGYISTLRYRYIRKLAKYAENFYQGISGGKESFSMEYEPSFGISDVSGFELSDFKEKIKQTLAKNRDEDIRLGSTSVGPHRDDLDIKVNQLSAKSFGSQGQQRSCILALKLGESCILEEQTGESPVIMLDDVMSELDQSRRHYLLNKLGNKQVFITCCDTGAFAELDQGKVFYMKKGILMAEQKI